MNDKKLTRLFLIAALTAFAVAASLVSCDMVYVDSLKSSEERTITELTEEERDGLEKNGRFLKLTHMPRYTQIPNIISVQIANSASPVAKLHKDNPVCIFRDSDESTVYLPLSYLDDSEFLETGFFYAAFTVHVDAVTAYIVNIADKLLVPFTDGRGQVDVRFLPDKSLSSREITEAERNDLEKNGRFLKLTHMPPNTQISNVFSVQITNSASPIAKLHKDNPVSVFRDNDTTTVYMPLSYLDDSEFLETGFFYAAFTVHVDAVTAYIVNIADKLLVPFTDGRGQVDVRFLPDKSLSSREITEAERNDLEKNGRFLKLTHMPPNTQISNVFSVQITNSASPIAKLHKDNPVSVFRDNDTTTVYMPLSYLDDSEFLETGFFYAAFTIHVDAVTAYIVNITDKLLVPFTDGRGQVDARSLPELLAPPVEQHYLTVFNLPPRLSAYSISNVLIHNQKETVAQCDDYSLLEISVDNNRAAARIPLFYCDSHSVFTETGSYFVSFDINVDAETRFLITRNDNVRVSFANGNGTLDIDILLQNPVPYLTVTGLPVHMAKNHISDVFVYNIAGPVASCNNYNNISIFKNNGYAVAMIPLSDPSGSDYFHDTGRFAVAFTVNVDVETQISVSQSDSVIVQFTEGSAEVDVRSLPDKNTPPIEQHYLTIVNLPPNLSAYSISNILIHNQKETVAQCNDYSLLEISFDNGRAAVRIPLSYCKLNSVFTETGSYFVSFDINVDAETRFLITRTDNIQVTFVNGNGFLDIDNIPKNPVPFLTITGLPFYTTKTHISNVYVHNLAGTVASCNNYNDISVVRNNEYATAMIPLSSSSSSGYFHDTGRFVISFTVNVDIETQIFIKQSDSVILQFTEGSAFFDIISTYGFFDAELVNPYPDVNVHEVWQKEKCPGE